MLHSEVYGDQSENARPRRPFVRGQHGNAALRSGPGARGPHAARTTCVRVKEDSGGWKVAGDEKRRKLSCEFCFMSVFRIPRGFADDATSRNTDDMSSENVV